MSILCETQHKTIIRRHNGVYIFDILHMIQNPPLHAGPSHLTMKSLQAIKQVVSFTLIIKLACYAILYMYHIN